MIRVPFLGEPATSRLRSHRRLPPLPGQLHGAATQRWPQHGGVRVGARAEEAVHVLGVLPW